MMRFNSRSTDEGTLACGNPIIEAEKDGTDKNHTFFSLHNIVRLNTSTIIIILKINGTIRLNDFSSIGRTIESRTH